MGGVFLCTVITVDDIAVGLGRLRTYSLFPFNARAFMIWNCKEAIVSMAGCLID